MKLIDKKNGIYTSFFHLVVCIWICCSLIWLLLSISLYSASILLSFLTLAHPNRRITINESQFWFLCGPFNEELSCTLVALRIGFWWDANLEYPGIGMFGQESTGYAYVTPGNNSETVCAPGEILSICPDATYSLYILYILNAAWSPDHHCSV